MSSMHPFLRSLTILGGLSLGVPAGCDGPSIEIREAPIRVKAETDGTGKTARRGDIATVDYVISLPSGEEVLRQTGYRFEVGAGAVIEGIDEVVEGMRAGGHRRFECPPHRHWGRRGYGDGVIPPNTTLTIELDLVKVE